MTMLGGPSPQAEVLHDFTDICGPSSNKLPFLVETLHWQSFDGRYWGFKCDPGDGKKKLIAYDLKEERILWIIPYTGSSTRGIWGAPLPSPSGRFFVTAQDIFEVRDRDTGKILRTIEPDFLAYQHMTMGLGVRDGREFDFYATLYNEGPPGTNSALIGIVLETGQIEWGYVPQSSGYPYPPSGIHHSADLLSPAELRLDFDHRVPERDRPSRNRRTDAFGEEILVTNMLDAAVGRVGHHRSRRGMNPVYNPKYNDYWQEPRISVSPTGCRAVFGSDWSAGPQERTPPQPKVDTFVVELPSFEGRAR